MEAAQLRGHIPQNLLGIVSQARRRDMVPLVLTTAKLSMRPALAGPQSSSEWGTL